MLISRCELIASDFSHFIFGHSTRRPSSTAHPSAMKLPKNQTIVTNSTKAIALVGFDSEKNTAVDVATNRAATMPVKSMAAPARTIILLRLKLPAGSIAPSTITNMLSGSTIHNWFKIYTRDMRAKAHISRVQDLMALLSFGDMERLSHYRLRICTVGRNVISSLLLVLAAGVGLFGAFIYLIELPTPSGSEWAWRQSWPFFLGAGVTAMLGFLLRERAS